jgi:hypothetical protein
MRPKSSVTCLQKCVTCFFLMNNMFRVLRNTLFIGISERVTSLLLFRGGCYADAKEVVMAQSTERKSVPSGRSPR